MRLEDLALIGNCQYAALIANDGNVAWCCLPRFDSEPQFAALLDPGDAGIFRIGSVGGGSGCQRYLPNSNVLETVFRDADGAFRVIDFAPRFLRHDRVFRPTQLFRIVEPIDGTPRVEVCCDPRLGWSKRRPAVYHGSNHLQYQGFASPLRLTTDLPLSYLDGRPFSLTQRHHVVLSWGEPVEESLPSLGEHYLQSTLRYWQGWVKHCNVPAHYQHEVIRSALALKLHCFEDTGAIIAAVTTSIPEAPGSGRTWDYRYCWLRDAYYALEAFRLLGHFEERESFIRFLLNTVGGGPIAGLSPLYRIDGRRDLEEQVLHHWSGYNGDGPVRIGNGAAQQLQHDIYGEMVLALAPVFLDERFAAEATEQTLVLLLRLAEHAIAVAGTPDAGIWEHRHPPVPRTFSSLMSWAAADRAQHIASRFAPDRATAFAAAAERLRREIMERAWNADLGSFTATYGGTTLDASLLEMVSLRFLPADDPRLVATVSTIQRDLTRNGWMLRYRDDDGLGATTTAFLICNFWLVEALAVLGHRDEARQALEFVLRLETPLGLLAEDCDPATRRMWGNFPQAYSHVGMIHAAFAASPRWSDIL
ncbi:MAG: glycoside hydrolase family 15 protein [Gammaproteobacteria bacterium]|nr:glycoside hydrolase family 15 protein [Gammaproteobacteria bacterium]